MNVYKRVFGSEKILLNNSYLHFTIGKLFYLDNHHGETQTRDCDMSTDPSP